MLSAHNEGRLEYYRGKKLLLLLLVKRAFSLAMGARSGKRLELYLTLL